MQQVILLWILKSTYIFHYLTIYFSCTLTACTQALVVHGLSRKITKRGGSVAEYSQQVGLAIRQSRDRVLLCSDPLDLFSVLRVQILGHVC